MSHSHSARSPPLAGPTSAAFRPPPVCCTGQFLRIAAQTGNLRILVDTPGVVEPLSVPDQGPPWSRSPSALLPGVASLMLRQLRERDASRSAGDPARPGRPPPARVPRRRRVAAVVATSIAARTRARAHAPEVWRLRGHPANAAEPRFYRYVYKGPRRPTISTSSR